MQNSLVCRCKDSLLPRATLHPSLQKYYLYTPNHILQPNSLDVVLQLVPYILSRNFPSGCINRS